MRLTHINVFNREIPSFAYLICENDGKYFVPIFANDNTVLDFRTVDCKIPPIKVKDEQQIEIEKGDHGLFAYYTVDNVLIADAEELVISLLELSKKQNMSESCLRSFEAFAKKYDVFTVYLKEYCKHYGYSDGTVKLLAHAATDNTNIFAKKWAIKTWARLQEQQPEVNSTICLNRTHEGEIRVSFGEENKEPGSKPLDSKDFILEWGNIPPVLIAQRGWVLNPKGFTPLNNKKRLVRENSNIYLLHVLSKINLQKQDDFESSPKRSCKLPNNNSVQHQRFIKDLPRYYGLKGEQANVIR